MLVRYVLYLNVSICICSNPLFVSVNRLHVDSIQQNKVIHTHTHFLYYKKQNEKG